jgi:hypothetical protein
MDFDDDWETLRGPRTPAAPTDGEIKIISAPGEIIGAGYFRFGGLIVSQALALEHWKGEPTVFKLSWQVFREVPIDSFQVFCFGRMVHTTPLNPVTLHAEDTLELEYTIRGLREIFDAEQEKRGETIPTVFSHVPVRNSRLSF